MPRLAFASQSYEDGDFSFPPEQLVNWYPEAMEGGETGFPFRLIPTRGPTLQAELTGAGRGLWHEPNAVGGHLFAAHGTTLSRLASNYTATSIGTIAGTDDRIKWAGSRTTLVLVAGGQAYATDGTTLSSLTIPEIVTTGVSDVEFINGRWLFVAKETGLFLYSDIGDPDTLDALQFLTADDAPDNLVALRVVGEIIYALGSATIERWVTTADAQIPFRPQVGGTIEAGCLAADSARRIDNSLMWVGRDRENTAPAVYRLAQGPQRVSTTAIEAALMRASAAGTLSTCEARVFGDRGEVFYALDIPGEGTWVYGAKAGRWHERRSYGQTLWRCRSTAFYGGATLAQNRTTGDVYALERGQRQELGNPIVRIATASLPFQDGRPAVDNVILRGTQGAGLDVAPDAAGYRPTIELRWSDDRGRTWKGPVSRSVGKIGEYQGLTRWNRLGRMRPPGRVFEFSLSEPVSFAIMGADINAKDA